MSKQLIHHMTVQKFVTKSGMNPKAFHKTGDNSYAFDVDLMEHDDVVSRLNDAWFETFGGPEQDVNGQAVAWALDDIIHTTSPFPSMMVKITICPVNQVTHVISAEDILANATPDDRPIVKPELPKVGDIVQNIQHGGSYTGKVIEVNDLGIEVEWHKGMDNTFTDVIWGNDDRWQKEIKVITSPVDREWWPEEPKTDILYNKPIDDSKCVDCGKPATTKVMSGEKLCDSCFRSRHGKLLMESRNRIKSGLQKPADNPNHPKPEAYPKVNSRSPMAPKPKVERKPKAEKPTRPCACGCGKETKSVFGMGHDARAKKLLRNLQKETAEGKQPSWTPNDNLIAYINISPAWKAEFGWVNDLKK